MAINFGNYNDKKKIEEGKTILKSSKEIIESGEEKQKEKEKIIIQKKTPKPVSQKKEFLYSDINNLKILITHLQKENESIRKELDEQKLGKNDIQKTLEEQHQAFMGEILELNEQINELNKEGDKGLELIATIKSIYDLIKSLEVPEKQIKYLLKSAKSKWSYGKGKYKSVEIIIDTVENWINELPNTLNYTKDILLNQINDF